MLIYAVVLILVMIATNNAAIHQFFAEKLHGARDEGRMSRKGAAK